jgi:phenylpropionate dioxygenase-like ring-hydroxylating dioxygenase large terminal subunit
MFLRKIWYVAAWASEVGEGLLARRILDEPILMYRQDNGDAVAIGERCPHRFAPLHLGRKVGDNIQCGYHGLVFGPTGACVANPRADGHVPPNAQVKAYPLAERHGLIWIWMDPALATTETIPELDFLEEVNLQSSPGYLHVRADYRLATDNLMDLTHAAYLHEETLGRITPELNSGKMRVSRDGTAITAAITMSDIALPSVPGRVDQWLDIKWRPPGVLVLDIGHVAQGGVRPNHGRRAIHAVTPETEATSHYFFRNAANRPDFKRDPFKDEDEPMLSACQTMMAGADFWSLKPAILPTDAGAVMVRRSLDQLIREEATV